MTPRAPRALAVVALVVAACQAAPSATLAISSAAAGCGTPAACEQRAADRLEAVRGDPAALTALLRRLPKGADLHNHLSGAVYAESYLTWAREDGLWIDADHKLVDAACDGCTKLPASPDDPRFAAIVRAWSMQDFDASAGETGHDHFFSTFGKFRMASHTPAREAAMIAEVIRRTGDDGALYLELLMNLSRPGRDDIVRDAGAPDPRDLTAYADKLQADPRWPALVAAAHDRLIDRDRQARALLGCGTPEAAPACGLTVRYLDDVGRTGPPGRVLADLLLAFEIAAIEPRVVGVDLSAPEDNPIARRDYDLHMAMIAALTARFRGTSPLRVTLHAGEITAALVPPADLGFHIRNAIEIAHAERIGHGVDVLGERDAPQLLAEMRARGVAVEVCLTSNAVILGVSGAAHPLAAYLAAGVPVVLATDDAGVSRSSLTGELVRAVTVQGVSYRQLKALARNSLTAAFVPGASLWAAGQPSALAAPCAGSVAPRPSSACSALLATSERARLQWALEARFAAFEAE